MHRRVMNLHRLACTAIVLATLTIACGRAEEANTSVVSPPPPPSTTVTPPTTPTPVVEAEPDEAQSADAEPWFDGIWPESRAALDRQRVAFDNGHQPWRADPVETAAAFLRSVGISEPVMGGFDLAGGRSGVVGYESGPVRGFVFLRRAEGNPLPYVVRLESPRFNVVQTEREGGVVRVEVNSVTPGTVIARAGSFTSEWQDEQKAPVSDGSPVTLALDVDDPRRPLILEVTHEGADGVVGRARLRVQPAAAGRPGPSGGDRLSANSRLRVGGIGPVEVGMTLDQALAAAGVPMTLRGSHYCEILSASGGPEFVNVVSTAESDGRITVITVSADSVSTEAGVRVGSTEDEVLAAYAGEIERRGSGDAHRLVHRPVPAAADDLALAFLVVNAKVVAMQTGGGAILDAQEYCS